MEIKERSWSSLRNLYGIKILEAQKMNEFLSVKTIEKITSEVLKSLDYKDYDAEIDWFKI